MTAPLNPIDPPAGSADTHRRELAIKRIRAKQAFRIHAVVYVLVNTLLVAIWAGLGDSVAVPGLPPAFFWPIFPILGWGLGLAIQGYSAFERGGPTEDEIEREMRNLPH